jgi:hypothetical protein
MNCRAMEEHPVAMGAFNPLMTQITLGQATPEQIAERLRRAAEETDTQRVAREAALAALEVAQLSRIDLQELDSEIRASAARLIARRALVTEQERQWTAHHEAGHGVIALKYGLPVEWITLGIEDNTLHPSHGRVTFANIEGTHSIEAFAVMAFAGAAAERLAGNGAAVGKSDREKAERAVLALGFTDPTREQFIRYCVYRAEEMVLAEWAWIQRAATALLTHDRLTSAEIEALQHVPSTEVAA